MLKSYISFLFAPILLIDAFYLFDSIFFYSIFLSLSFLFNSLKNISFYRIFNGKYSNLNEEFSKLFDYNFYMFDFSDIYYLVTILSFIFIFSLILSDFKVNYFSFKFIKKENEEKINLLELKIKILEDEISKNRDEFSNFLEFLNDIEKNPFEASSKIIRKFLSYDNFYIYEINRARAVYNEGLLNKSEIFLDFIKSLSKLYSKSYKLIKDKNFVEQIGFHSNRLFYFIFEIEDKKLAFITLFNANKNALFELKFFDTLINILNYFYTFPFKKHFEIRKNMKENIEYFEAANRDALTNIYSRTYLKEYKMQKDCFVAMIDCDDFKKVNDFKGHLKGDEILKKLAFLINNAFEDCDAFRYGGDEFLLIIFEKDISKVISRFENIIARSPISISIGIYYSKDNILDIAKEKADKALYKAKKLGKNQIAVWTKDLKEV